MKTVFVTGANGLLGTNLVHEMLSHGWQVMALVRNPDNYKGEQHPYLELIKGNLFDDLAPYMKECGVVIHIAAETRQDLLHYSDYQKTNCEATRSLFQSALESRSVKKFVFVSSANTVGHSDFFELGSEDKAVRFPFKESYYAKSKLEAENFLLQNKENMDVVIVNPTFMLGAYDTKPSSGKIILMGWKKYILFYPPGGKNFVDVKDVSRGIVSCIEKGKNGEKYLLANNNLTYKAFFELLSEYSNQRPIMIGIPKWLLHLLGYGGNCVRFFGLQTSMSLTNMRILCQDNFFTNKKSVKSLGMRYRPIDGAIQDAVSYFKSENILK